MDNLKRVCISAPEHSLTACNSLVSPTRIEEIYQKKKLQHISAPSDHLTAQGEDIFKIDFTKIRPVVLWDVSKGRFSLSDSLIAVRAFGIGKVKIGSEGQAK